MFLVIYWKTWWLCVYPNYYKKIVYFFFFTIYKNDNFIFKRLKAIAKSRDRKYYGKKSPKDLLKLVNDSNIKISISKNENKSRKISKN